MRNGGIVLSQDIYQQNKFINYLDSHQRFNVIQRFLADDFENDNIDKAIVGEYHYEIPAAEEIEIWKNEAITVIYEHDEIPSTETKPDPPLLRLFFAWEKFVELAKDCANNIINGGELYFLNCFISEMENINPSVDNLLFEIYSDAKLLQEKMKNWVNLKYYEFVYVMMKSFDSISKLNYKVLRLRQKCNVKAIDSIDLRKQRSLNMLRKINNTTQKMFIYKVGDAHINDIMNFSHDRPNHNVKVLSRNDYLLSYKDLKSIYSIDENEHDLYYL